MRTLHSTTRPDGFQLNKIDGKIVYAEWRDNIRELESGGFVADAHPVEGICVPATEGEATRLLMLCRYPDPSAECAIVRRSDDDEERIEHEAYHARVKEFISQGV